MTETTTSIVSLVVIAVVVASVVVILWRRWSREFKQDKAELKSALAEVVESYQTSPVHEKHQIDNLITNLVAEHLPTFSKSLNQIIGSPAQHVCPHASAIVTYSISSNSSESIVNERLRQILDANPKADLEKYQVPLGITIIRIERRGGAAGIYG